MNGYHDHEDYDYDWSSPRWLTDDSIPKWWVGLMVLIVGYWGWHLIRWVW